MFEGQNEHTVFEPTCEKVKGSEIISNEHLF